MRARARSESDAAAAGGGEKGGSLGGVRRRSRGSVAWGPALRRRVEQTLLAWTVEDDRETSARNAVARAVLANLADLHGGAPTATDSPFGPLEPAEMRERRRLRYLLLEHSNFSLHEDVPELLFAAGLTSMEALRSIDDDELARLVPGLMLYQREFILTAVAEGQEMLPVLELKLAAVSSLPEIEVPLGNVVLNFRDIEGESDLFVTSFKIPPFTAWGSFTVEFASMELILSEHIEVYGNVSVYHCGGLDSLPFQQIDGTLHIIGWNNLVSLRENLVVFGDVDIQAEKLQHLPEGLVIHGDAAFDLENLEVLPEKFKFYKNVSLFSCEKLTALPPGFRIEGGDLDVSFSGIEDLGEGLHVSGSLVASDCINLRNLPEQFFIGEDLILDGCVSLERLLDGLFVAGDLDLANCVALERLPEDLVVDRTLSVAFCSALSALPDHFWVGSILDLEGTENLTRLPDCIFEWGEGGDETGAVREIYLHGSGIPIEEIERLRDINPRFLRIHVTAQFATFELLDDLFSMSSSKFDSIDEAVAFWCTQSAPDADDEVPDLDLTGIVPKEFERGLKLFLTKLKGAQEFRNPETRSSIAKRVVEALQTLVEDEESRTEMLIRMADSVDACADKPTHSLNQMTLISKIVKARGNRGALRELGRGVMNLDIVHKHVRMKINRMNLVDDVCIYLKFEIELKEDLNLPVSATAFLFPNYMRVEESELNYAREECEAVTEEAFEAWLLTWPEWQRQLRHEAAQKFRFADLPRNSRRFSLSWTDLLGNTDISDPVRIDKKGPVWSLSDLLKFWVVSGCDPHNQKRSIEEMMRMTRCRSLRLSAEKRRSSKKKEEKFPSIAEC